MMGLLCYVGVNIVLMALENRLIYRPTLAHEDWVPAPFSPVEDINLTLADGTNIHGWWCPEEGAEGVLLFCHGNAGNLSHRGTGIREVQKRLGQSVLIFDYPGYGRSAGRPTEQGCYAAADAAYDWLTQTKGIRADQILLYGGSLGGAVAIDLASRKPHRALVVDKTFTSMPDVAQSLYPWLPVRWLMRNRFDNLAKIRLCRQPVFIAHGTTDDLVPFVHGKRLFAAANEPKVFLCLEGCGHNDPLPGEFFESLRGFLARVEASQATNPSPRRALPGVP
jgi:fermentation-respiration switch protein FrsA (DUF1100 family)